MTVFDTSAPMPVLDHGFVRLVDVMGSDLSIARAARVSYAAAWRAGGSDGDDERLIRYLWMHQHTTPFEAVTLTFEVKAPIFVLRQWHRHRTQSYNELSARYRELPREFYVPATDTIGTQSATNKQGRDLSALPGDMTMNLGAYVRTCEQAYKTYERLLAAGWPRELARAVLPVSMYSHMFTTMNLLNCLRFLTLRCDEHAQYEIRQYANAMAALVEPVVPVAMRAWRTIRSTTVQVGV